jgi:hypothetical protein
MVSQYIFNDPDWNEYFLIDIYEDTIDGTVVTLKVKRDGWSDIWSLPLKQVKGAE